ncbi:MAG: lysophospholipid acyltransferase family protein [Fimbriimonadaceae bacterium]|jgi:hypothetical protein|nr:lysophospholipid acyltransferase family protein [Fimbriimonadaceae bacterium]
MKQWWRNVRPIVASRPLYWFIRLLLMTVKLKTEGWEEFQSLEGGKIFAAWHGRTIMGTHLFRNQGVYCIISHSKDGEMQNYIFSKFGFKTIRGSTGRGGMKAAIEAIRVLREGHTIAFTPDGPRGPSGIVQSGIMLMARKSGAALIPVGFSVDRRWLFRSWDRYLIPKPFSKALMIFGEPIYVSDQAGEAEEEIRRKFEDEIRRLEALAEARFGHPAPNWHADQDAPPPPPPTN